MDGRMLSQLAAERAEELPGAELEHPFGPEWDVFKVRDRIFLLLTAHAGDTVINVKVRPEDGVALREAFAEIIPGYHMDKRHWISVRPGPGIEPGLVHELVTESYRLVVEKLPRARRPVDPDTFGLPEPAAR